MFSARTRIKLSLYRTSIVFSIMAALLVGLGIAASSSSFQRRGPHKLRATGLVEINRDSSGRVSAVLTPITILDNGRFQDASIYKSRPRPMAIEDGVVYEVQKTGVPVGYVTIDNAQVKNDIWIAEGRWQPAPQPSEAPARSAQAQPSSSGSSGSGDDRPILHRGGNQPPPPQAEPPSSPPPDSEPEPQDPNRPVLRRRKPEPEATPVPTPTPNTTRGQPPSRRPTPPQVLDTPGKQVLVGVSDAEATETRSFEFNWRPQEREQIEAKMRRLAIEQLPGVKNQVNQPALTNVIIRSFDVDMSNDAVVVLTAEVPGGYLATETPAPPKKPPTRTGRKQPAKGTQAPATPAEEPPAAKFVSRFIAVIARIDLDGNPHNLAASVTDSSRLDVAPRLELIDAVDVDGDGLAELLFREYSFDQKSFVIYGIGHGTVTKVFEGASQPLH
jgi:hypothetical protein